MSQDYHHHPGLFSFSNGFERSPAETLQHHHVVQQIRRDKVPPPQQQQLEEEDEHPVGLAGSNETSGMLSEMFNFQHGTARELLESQIYHHHGQQSQPQMAAAMQLFHMNPSPSPSPSSNHSAAAASTFHVSSVPNPSPTSTLQGFHSHAPTGGHFSQFAWGDGGTAAAAAGEGQGLSLSLSSAKAGEEFRISGDAAGMLFFSQGMASASSEYPCKNNLNLNGGGGGGGVMDHHHIHVGFGSSIGVINGLRHSKYAKPAQELLDEFCSVVVSAHHQFNKNKSQNPNSNPTSSDAVDGGDAPNNNSSSSSKPTPPLSTADRVEHQRRKVKLLSMLDEVDRRYNRYCEQMQMVVNSFDLVMGFGAAAPYTVQAQKAMSRHFRCLKDAVVAQLKHSCEMLGEKDGGASSGLTKGETPRLKMLEQTLRQQRAFHQMGMMEPEAWRPQRGLPERSVNALRAWLFEHFLHPYPSDADKHMLARQTGLSRSQVSNWFINARVRLWKPMVEEMYQEEVKVGDSENMDSPSSGDDTVVAQTPTPNAVSNSPTTTTVPPPPSAAAAVTATAADTVAAAGKRSEINAAHESDPSLLAINTQCFSRNQASTCHRRGTADSGKADIGSALIRFGTSNAAAGNVSLTLGLRHAGNLPDQNHFFG